MCMCTFFYICTYFSFCVAATRSLAHLDTTAHRFSAYSKVCVIFLRTCRLFNVCVTATCLFCSFTRSMLFQLFGKIFDFSTQLNVLIRLCTFRFFCAMTRCSNSSTCSGTWAHFSRVFFMHVHVFSVCVTATLFFCALARHSVSSMPFQCIGQFFLHICTFLCIWVSAIRSFCVYTLFSTCSVGFLRIATFIFLLHAFSAYWKVSHLFCGCARSYAFVHVLLRVCNCNYLFIHFSNVSTYFLRIGTFSNCSMIFQRIQKFAPFFCFLTHARFLRFGTFLHCSSVFESFVDCFAHVHVCVTATRFLWAFVRFPSPPHFSTH